MNFLLFMHRSNSHSQRLGNSLLLPALLFEGQCLPPSRFLPVGGSWKSFCHASPYHGQKSLEIYATVSNIFEPRRRETSERRTICEFLTPLSLLLKKGGHLFRIGPSVI